MRKKQYAAIDLLKIICALLVIGIHTAPFMDVSLELDFFVVQVLARLAVPFFFIISGFFLYSHIDFSKTWKDSDNINYIKKYTLRILKIYCIWSLLYLPLNIWSAYKEGFQFIFIIRYLRDFIFNGSYYHLWYLPGLLFASVFIYYMMLQFGKKKTFFTVITLYIIGSAYNIFSVSFLDNSLIALYQNIFTTTRNGLFFGSIFMYLGAVLANTKDFMNKKTCLIAGSVSFLMMVIEIYTLKQFGFMHPLASMYLFLVPTVFFFFQYLIQVEITFHPFYKILRDMSLLLYVSHIIFVTILTILVPHWNSFVLYCMVVVLSCVFSYGVIYFHKRFPILCNLY